MSTRTISTTKTSAPGSPPKDSALEFHNRLIEEKGVHAASGFSQRSRNTRFHIIERCLREFPDPDLTVLDYGCNDGALFDCLKGSVTRYIGMDINPKLIKWAKERWKDRANGKAKFKVGNALEDETYDRLLLLKPDVIIASGVMSYRGDARSYPELIYRLFTCAQHGVIFNVLTADAPKNLVVPQKSLVRWKPEQLLKLVRACGCNSWEVIRSYLHNDMTVVMRKQWTHFT